MPFDAKDPDTIAALEAAVADATAKLIAKNKELIAENRKRAGSPSAEELERAESERDEWKDKATKAERDRVAAEKAAKTASDALSAEQSATHSLLVDNAVSAALTKAGILQSDFVKAKYLPLFKVTEAEGKKKIANAEGKDPEAFVGEWIKSDEAKHFLPAAGSTGGGALGGAGGASNADMMKLSPAARLDAARAAGMKT